MPRITLSRICILIMISFMSLSISLCRGSIVDYKTIQVDFKNIADATTKTTWSNTTLFTVTKEGLGWNGDALSFRHGWIQTKPLALGFVWRTTSIMHVNAQITQVPAEIISSNGQKMTPTKSSMFARYSPDKKHWSSWQSLQSTDTPGTPAQTILIKHYSALLQVPDIEKEEYRNLLSKYSQLDVPWKSNEEDAVKWILKDDPEFFSKHLPFMGYIEFLYDGDFYSNQRIQTLRVEGGYGISGVHAIPKDEKLYKEIFQIPWRFDASTNKSE